MIGIELKYFPLHTIYNTK